MKKVAIGGGQGFWGDSPDAAIHMIRNADIQYMGCDYLAELTLSIMAKQQLKDPTKGFVPDFTTRIPLCIFFRRVDAERGFQGIQSGEGIFSQCYGQHDTSK